MRPKAMHIITNSKQDSHTTIILSWHVFKKRKYSWFNMKSVKVYGVNLWDNLPVTNITSGDIETACLLS